MRRNHGRNKIMNRRERKAAAKEKQLLEIQEMLKYVQLVKISNDEISKNRNKMYPLLIA